MDTPDGAIPAFMDDTRQSVEPTLDDCRVHNSTASASDATIELFNKPLCTEAESSGAARILNGVTLAVDAAFSLAGHGVAFESHTQEAGAALSATAAVGLLDAGASIIGRARIDESVIPGFVAHAVANAVAIDTVHAGLGLDMGGCLREHAAWLGLVGFTPSYGRVSKHGVAVLSPTCSNVGILAHSVKDAARIFSAINGADPADSTTAGLRHWGETEAIESGIQDLRFAIPGEYLVDDLQPECRDAVVRALTWLMAEGAAAAGAHVTTTEYAPAAFTAIFNAEAAENIARYGGFRQGEGTEHVLPFLLERHASHLSADMQRRLILGAHVASAAGGARYCQVMKVRRKIALDFEKQFEEADILITPTTVRTASGSSASEERPRASCEASTLTCAAGLAGIPATTIPVGTDANGFPVGLQLMAKPMNETALFRAAVALQKGIAHW